MDPAANPALFAILFAGGLFLGMLAFVEIGRRLGALRQTGDREGGTGVIDGAVFALFGLLVAFTFSGAGSRFDGRRALITQEANAIGTAWLRLDLLPPTAQPALKKLFREYVDARLATYQDLSDLASSRSHYARSLAIQAEIWRQAVAAAGSAPAPAATMLLLPALNDMIDITTTRLMATRTHPPAILFGLLFILALGCSLLAGVGMATGQRRNWLHMTAFAAITAVTVYVILDLEYPRLGLIRVDAADQLLIELREGMK
jgi:hypothetical protein